MVDSVHSSRYRLLCEILVEARKARKLSQAALAEQIGRVQTFVSKYERGERRLDLVEFIDVAAALELDAVRILRQLQTVDGKQLRKTRKVGGDAV